MSKYRYFQSRGHRAFTLVEVMIATLVASVALLAVLGTAFMTYKINHKARLRDNARAVLRTYIDQFQRLAYANDAKVVRMLFNPAEGNDTGLGLRWGKLSDETARQIEDPEPTERKIDIGPPGSPQYAFVTRNIAYVNTSTGEVSSTITKDAAGIMMRATFTITYTIAGITENRVTQSMSSARLID
jgi:prepilin-type N-terminal cleavage/methylation domain-containing protein